MITESIVSEQQANSKMIALFPANVEISRSVRPNTAEVRPSSVLDGLLEFDQSKHFHSSPVSQTPMGNQSQNYKLGMN